MYNYDKYRCPYCNGILDAWDGYKCDCQESKGKTVDACQNNLSRDGMRKNEETIKV